MKVERVQNPAQKIVLLAGVGAGCGHSNSHSGCNSNANSAQWQTGTLEGTRQLYRQLSVSLPQLPR